MLSKIKSWFKKQPLLKTEVPIVVPDGRALTGNYSIPRTPQKSNKPDEGLDLNVLAEEMEKVKQKENKAIKILDILEIPHISGPAVRATTLVEILMNEEKFKKLSSKLRLKAFW